MGRLTCNSWRSNISNLSISTLRSSFTWRPLRTWLSYWPHSTLRTTETFLSSWPRGSCHPKRTLDSNRSRRSKQSVLTTLSLCSTRTREASSAYQTQMQTTLLTDGVVKFNYQNRNLRHNKLRTAHLLTNH